MATSDEIIQQAAGRLNNSARPTKSPENSVAAGEWDVILKARGDAVEQMYREASPQLLPKQFDPGEWQSPFLRFNAGTHPQAARASQAVRDWVFRVSSGEPRGLILWSSGYGAGKTMLAELAAECLKVMLDHNGQPQRVTFMTAPDFFQKIKDAYSNSEPIAAIYRDWVRGHFILDDWGKQYTTVSGEEWAREQFFHLVNALVDKHGILITSNASPEQMSRQVGGASWSRLLGMCGPEGVIDMSSVPDFRLKKAGF